MGDGKKPCLSPQPRQKIPKDGWGPHGGGECYYTSRVLNSTGRYVQFVKKLRMKEEEDRIGRRNQNKVNVDNQVFEFFTRSDRKNCVKTVVDRVRLCMESYENDLQEKRVRLTQLLEKENEHNLYEFVKRAQAGAEAVFQDKVDRLAYLLGKRKKEHEEKYKAIPLEKCPHIYPYLVQRRAKEAQEIQLYQMKEKQMRKMSEAEVEHMWHEVTLKESEAMAARVEMDVIERFRRDKECQKYSEAILQQRHQARVRDRERLKQETLLMKALKEEDDRLEAEKQRQLKEKAKAIANSRDQYNLENKDEIEKHKAEQKLISELWDSLARQRLADENAEIDNRKRMERELDICNKKMAEMKNCLGEEKYNTDEHILQEGQRIRDEMDYKRCLIREKNKRDRMANQQYVLKQIQEKKDSIVTEVNRAQLEYDPQLQHQMSELVKHKQMTDAQARKLYQRDLRDQIAYNNLLKERALQEERDQMKKYEIAKAEYQEQMNEMLSRPHFSDRVHPFLAKMNPSIQKRCQNATPKEGETSKKKNEDDSAQKY